MNMSVGVVSEDFSKEEIAQFRTTTPRVVGVELNMNNLTLNFWLNGRSQETRNKKISKGTWIPAIKIREQGN